MATAYDPHLSGGVARLKRDRYLPILEMGNAVPAGGIEQEYNNLLSGTPARFVIPYDPNQLREIPTVSPGGSIILTIDIQLQAVAEQIVDEAVASTQSDSGTIIILDPRTGEVLAMATAPRINLNEYWKIKELDPNMPFNRAVNITYEPGSVFKPITMAIALHLGRVKPDTTFVDTGSFQAGDFPVQNWDGRAYGQVTMTECMQYSLNVCLAHVAVEEIGEADFYSYLNQFGIGQRSRIDLAGEAVYPYVPREMKLGVFPIWRAIPSGKLSRLRRFKLPAPFPQ